MDKKNIIFDNNDKRIKYYELILEKDLTEIPEINLPEGYKFVFYKNGDKDAWIEIEKSAKEFDSYSQGANAWKKYYGTKLNELPERMVFIENAERFKIATATAFYNIYRQDSPLCGWLHWVAIKKEYQNKGLSRPLILFTLNVMKKLGYTHAKIPTQTNTWLACKIYLDLGFLPVKENAIHSSYGWRIIKTLTDHPALKDFSVLPLEEIII